MTDVVVFGLELQRARERRGLSLDQLADATKISASLFAGLERGDLSRWPTGIFRRAFVRSYAQAVGLDREETLARFLRLHPDTDEASTPAGTAADDPQEDEDVPTPRLLLDQSSAGLERWQVARRIGAPAVDLLIAGLPALAVSVALGWQWFWVVGGGIGLVGHAIVLSLVGATPGAWLLLARPAPRALMVAADPPARRRAEPETAPSPRRRQPRHASGARSTAAARARRVQH